MKNTNNTLIAKTITGLEELLADELKALGAQEVQPLKRAVSFQGDTRLMYAANLHCRTAISILKEVARFTFNSREEYYDNLRAVLWDELFTVDKSISINAIAHRSEIFNNTLFLAQHSKDAIVDYFRDKYQERPSVDIGNAHIRISIYVNADECIVSLDSSGDPLFKRGYRKATGAAPINEVLAAGLIMLSGWDKQSTLVDPMCGSGTFSIEAAMMALDIAPSLNRKSFSFLFWNDFQPELWKTLVDEARTKVRNRMNTTIIASDLNGQTLDIARQNIMEAGLMGQIRVQRNDFFTFQPPAQTGWALFNPPYGERMKRNNLSEFYRDMGNVLKKNYAGYRAGFITSDLDAMKYIGLKPSSKTQVFNGPLDCRFLVFDLFTGTHKDHVIRTRPKRPRLEL
ncbi:MAG: THUMP domain-containing protein [Bacteroidales bacterium]